VLDGGAGLIELTPCGVLEFTKVAEQILSRTLQRRALWNFVSGHRRGRGERCRWKGLSGLAILPD
jgi:hypothetical protein